MNKKLLLVPSAPAVELLGGSLRLDIKFVEGMHQYCDLWQGSVHCVLRLGSEAIPFGAEYSASDLAFDLTLLPKGGRIGQDFLEQFDVVLFAGDMTDDLHVASVRRVRKTRLVYAIEYTLETRLQIIALDTEKNLLRKFYSGAWTLYQEVRRRRAFRHADGLQANGWPAFAAYRPLSSVPMMYLDSRMRADMFATAAEMEIRFTRLQAGAPLRLVYSGRLEALKGVQDLVPLCNKLRKRQVDFTLAIYGAGSQSRALKEAVSSAELEQYVSFKGAVDFERQLVPACRSESDIFVCCHPQSDPSCTYLESLACGLPVVGYENSMWSALQRESGGGWTVPLGQIDALADRIAELDGNRSEIVECGIRAREYAATRDFHTEFRRRVEHLASLL